MNLKNIVESYAHKGKQGLEIDLDALALNKEFNEEVVKKVSNIVPPQACVFIPGYNDKNAHFTKLINDLVLSLQTKALVTGNIESLKNVETSDVIIIKQSFRTGQTLRTQIAELRTMGFEKIKVLCIITNSTGRLKGFAIEEGVEVDALVKTDEIEYIPG